MRGAIFRTMMYGEDIETAIENSRLVRSQLRRKQTIKKNVVRPDMNMIMKLGKAMK